MPQAGRVKTSLITSCIKRDNVADGTAVAWDFGNSIKGDNDDEKTANCSYCNARNNIDRV